MNDDVELTAVLPAEKDGHDPEWRSTADPDEEVEVTCDCCPDCGEYFDGRWASAPTR